MEVTTLPYSVLNEKKKKKLWLNWALTCLKGPCLCYLQKPKKSPRLNFFELVIGLWGHLDLPACYIHLTSVSWASFFLKLWKLCQKKKKKKKQV